MGVVTKHYCNECHKLPDSNVENKGISLASRFVSHTYVTGRTFTAHPITSALLITALLATSVAGAVLLGTGLIIPGAAVLGVAYAVGVVAVALFFRGRRNADSDVHKEAHSLDRMQNFIQLDQKVCLVIEGIHDHNGALKNKGPKKWEKTYPVIHIKVSSIDEMSAAIEKVADIAKIQVLWIAGHGNSSLIKLGDKDEERIARDNVNLLEHAFSRLELDATIIASSCRTAKISDKYSCPPIASQLSVAAQGRPVIASTDALFYNNVILKGGKKPKIRMEMHKWGKHANFLDILTPNFIGKYFRKNIMAIYQNGILQDRSSHHV